MLNNVTLVGRLVKTPEVKIIGEGTAVCNFTVAVNRPYKKDGESVADFIQCQAWGKQAEFMTSYLSKGQLIGVTGAINVRNYDAEDGSKRYVTEVNCNSVQALEGKRETEPQTAEEIKAVWKAEYEKKSVGLDSTSKSNLKKQLAEKYQPMIDALEQDLPF